MSNDEKGEDCADLSEHACRCQTRSFTLQLAAKAATKCADMLASSRVVLPWLLGSIGAPAYFTAWLVPLRESLSLLPQLFVAARLREMPRRKFAYVAGALIQAVSLLLIPATLLLPTPTFSASAILLCLGVLSLARGLCSVSSKDVLGKTVAKGRRGRLSGIAGSIAGVFTLGFAAFLYILGDRASQTVLLLMIGCAGLLWLGAATLYALIPEEKGETEGSGDAIAAAWSNLQLLRSEQRLRQFIVARIVLVATAFAVPFLVIACFQESSGSFTALAAILLAEGLAALSSSAIWGWMADRASHRVMAASGVFSAVAMAAVLLGLPLGASGWTGTMASGLVLYLAAVAHQGTRLGRKTYLVDLANTDNRAAFTAVSNTVIGVCLIAGGALGGLASAAGNDAVLLVLLVFALLGAAISWRLTPP